jgi:hypothetical protein
LVLVHAFVFDAVRARALEELREGAEWAADVLGSGSIDAASRDERLWRRSTERELAAALGTLWNDDEYAARARAALETRLKSIDAPVLGVDTLFDEAHEEEIFPVLVDAGWELYPLAALDPERHKGAIDAFGDAFTFECAKFEEASLLETEAPLHELPALGPAELLHGAEHAILRAPLVVWAEGNETYQDYVLRGVLRAAKLD